MGWFARYRERNLRRIETMHRDPLPDRGGHFARKGVSVIAQDPDGNRVRVDFHLPVSEGKAVYFADAIARGEPHEGAAVTITPTRS